LPARAEVVGFLELPSGKRSSGTLFRLLLEES
jgi:hypothetical protein